MLVVRELPIGCPNRIRKYLCKCVTCLVIQLPLGCLIGEHDQVVPDCRLQLLEADDLTPEPRVFSWKESVQSAGQRYGDGAVPQS